MSQSDLTSHWIRLFEVSVLLVQPGMRQVLVFWILQGQLYLTTAERFLADVEGARLGRAGPTGTWAWTVGCYLMLMWATGKNTLLITIARVCFLTITFMLWNSVQGKSKTWRRMRLPLHLDYHDEQYLKVCWLVFQGFGLFLGAMGKRVSLSERQETMLTS